MKTSLSWKRVQNLFQAALLIASPLNLTLCVHVVCLLHIWRSYLFFLPLGRNSFKVEKLIGLQCRIDTAQQNQDTEHMAPFQSGQQASPGWNCGFRTRGRTRGRMERARLVSANMVPGEHGQKGKKLLSTQFECGRRQRGTCRTVQ